MKKIVLIIPLFLMTMFILVGCQSQLIKQYQLGNKIKITKEIDDTKYLSSIDTEKDYLIGRISGSSKKPFLLSQLDIRYLYEGTRDVDGIMKIDYSGNNPLIYLFITSNITSGPNKGKEEKISFYLENNIAYYRIENEVKDEKIKIDLKYTSFEKDVVSLKATLSRLTNPFNEKKDKKISGEDSKKRVIIEYQINETDYNLRYIFKKGLLKLLSFGDFENHINILFAYNNPHIKAPEDLSSYKRYLSEYN